MWRTTRRSLVADTWTKRKVDLAEMEQLAEAAVRMIRPEEMAVGTVEIP